MAEEWSAFSSTNNSQFSSANRRNFRMPENNHQSSGVYGLSSYPFQVPHSDIDSSQSLALMNTNGHVNTVAGGQVYGLPENHSFQVSLTENSPYYPSIDGRQNRPLMNTNGHGISVTGSQFYGLPENDPFQSLSRKINTYNPSINGRQNPATINANGRNSSFPDPFCDFPLESEFSHLSLLTNPANFRGTVGGGGGGGSRGSGGRVVPNNRMAQYSEAQCCDLQTMRIQSAARGQNLDLYTRPRNYSTPGFDETALQYALNSNAISRYNNRSLMGEETNRNPPRALNATRNTSLSLGGMGYGSDELNLSRYGGYGLNIINGFDFNNGSSLRSYVRPTFTSLDELMGKIFLAAKNQYGCRFLVRKIEEGKPQDIEMIFLEVKPHVCELMMNQFGNCLIQKLFEACSQIQMDELLVLVMEEERILMTICLDVHGTRAMQKLLEQLKTQKQKSIAISGLKRIAVRLTKSMSGHHVIQHCLKFFSSEENKHILNAVIENCLDIATDKSGCCVIQQCVAHTQGEPRDRLVQEITANALTLSEHPYGNYVVQYILGLRIPHVTKDILNRLSGSYIHLSMNKYGSNVVEKCLKESTVDEVEQIVNELFNSPHWLTIIQHPFGNYVVQCALDVSKGNLHNALVNFNQSHFPFLNTHPHGKRVLAHRGNKNRK